MDEADNELRDVICKLWPNLAKKPIKLHEGGTKSLLDLVVPPKNGRSSTMYLSSNSSITFFRTTRHSWLSKTNCWQSVRYMSIRR